MYRFSSITWRHTWSIVLLVVACVLAIQVGAELGSHMDAASALTLGAQSRGTGHPVSGPPARLSVVDLHSLPPAPAVHSIPLPFRPPRGSAALAAAQAAARNSSVTDF